MSLAQIKRLEDEATAAYGEAKSEMDKVGDDAMSEEKDAEVEKLLDLHGKKMALATKMKEAIDLEKKMNAPERKHDHADAIPLEGKEAKDAAKAEYKATYERYLHNCKHQGTLEAVEVKTLSSRTDPDGGYIVHEDMRSGIIQALRDLVQIRSRSTVISTNAQSVSFPSFEFDGTVSHIQENEAIPVQDIADIFGKETFTPHKQSTIFKVPAELMEDGDFDITQFLINHFSMRLGEIEENLLLNGNGVNQGLGLLNAGLPTTAFETSSSNQVTADDIVAIPYEIRAVYRNSPGVAYMMHRNFVKQVRKLKEGSLTPSDDSVNFATGAYLWQPSLKAGEPATLNGFPLLESEFMPDGTSSTTGDPYIIFADFRHNWIVDRTGLSIQLLTEKYAENDQIGVKLRRRTDSAPVLRDPFQIMVRKA